MTAEDIQKSHDFNTTPHQSNNIMVIGVGGGGNNAVNHMFNQGIQNVSFVVVNTDRQDLNKSPVPTKVLLGNGLGAGNKPEVASKAAEESAEQIADLFNSDTNMVFITAGMGGGTGTGASPVVARIAREKGLLTIGIVTIPFLFEGEKKIVKALNGAKELGKYVDALLVINNDRLAEIYKDFDFLNAFAKADDTLLTAAQSISEIITLEGYLNLDFHDVDTTLRNGGTAIISTGYGEGPNRVTKAINDALHSPLLKNTDVFGSKKLLFNLYFSPEADEPFKMEETNEIRDFISNIDTNVDVIWGTTFDKSLGNKVKFTILAAGFDVTVNDDTTSPRSFSGAPIKEPTAVSHASSNTQTSDDDRDAIVKEYGQNAVSMRSRVEEQRYIILSPDQLDDDVAIQTLENNPTFNRVKSIKNNLRLNTYTENSAEKTAAKEESPEAPKPQNGSANIIDFSME